jgi:GxxExxY protein
MPARAIHLLEGATTGAIISASLTVHGTLGFGCREHIYSLAMERELTSMGHRVEREVAVMIYYRGEPLTWQTFDMIVGGRVIVENKAREQLPEGSTEQLFSYLCSTNLEVGMLLHFGRKVRFHRVICENRYKQHHHSSKGKTHEMLRSPVSTRRLPLVSVSQR